MMGSLAARPVPRELELAALLRRFEPSGHTETAARACKDPR